MYVLDDLSFFHVNKKGSALGISSDWKYPSNEEIFLGKMADTNLESRKFYVRYYKSKNTKYYEDGLKFIDDSINFFVDV